MESNKENPIHVALEVVAEQEKNAKYSKVISWGTVILGVFSIAIFTYEQIMANEIQIQSKELFAEIQDNKLTKLIIDIVDTKIDLFRAEMKVRNSISGVIGGVLLGVGGAGLIGRKKKAKQVSAMKAIIHFIEK